MVAEAVVPETTEPLTPPVRICVVKRSVASATATTVLFTLSRGCGVLVRVQVIRSLFWMAISNGCVVPDGNTVVLLVSALVQLMLV